MSTFPATPAPDEGEARPSDGAEPLAGLSPGSGRDRCQTPISADALRRESFIVPDPGVPAKIYLGRARILVIDDSPTYLRLLSDLLLREGSILATETTGERALLRARAEPFDCAIVDLVLPDMDGFEACRLLREMRRGMVSPMALVILSAHEEQAHVVRGLDAGADDYIGKSIAPNAIVSRIGALLRHKRLHEERRRLAEERAARALEEARGQVKDARAQLLRSERSAWFGRLAAGIAGQIEGAIGAPGGELPPPGEAGRLLCQLAALVRPEEEALGVLDVPACIDLVLAALRPELEGRIEIRVEHRARRALDCRASDIVHALANLIGNAIEAVAGCGRISIRTEEIDRRYHVRVRDDGRGIVPDLEGRIFEPFFGTGPGATGSGLGLSLAYAIAQAHEGDIIVRSRPGEGAEFALAIPLDLRERLCA